MLQAGLETELKRRKDTISELERRLQLASAKIEIKEQENKVIVQKLLDSQA